jgi:hypothetical protein
MSTGASYGAYIGGCVAYLCMYIPIYVYVYLYLSMGVGVCYDSPLVLKRVLIAATNVHRSVLQCVCELCLS